MRTFLPWSAPLLPAAAKCLLDEAAKNTPKSFDADLSSQVIVVRGRNAGRRLLGLLAAEAQSIKRALIPPRIVTPGSLDAVLLGLKKNVAGRLVQRLAWMQVVKHADKAMLDKVWQSPSEQDRPNALGRFLDQTWQELSTSESEFVGAFRLLCEIAPEASVHEESRWNSLDHLLRDYRHCLETWKMIDPADFRHGEAKCVALNADAQIVLVGVVELAPVLVSLLKKLPNEPRVFVHAPETEAAGFDVWGRLVSGYWAKQPCHFDRGEIHVVADASQQAERCAELIHDWRELGVPESAITVAAPESDAIPLLDQYLRDRGIKVRLAEGQPASHSTVLQLLSTVGECLDSGFDSPQRYSAVASLVRHPDVEKRLGHSAWIFDRYFNTHLPERLAFLTDPDYKLNERIAEIMGRVSELTQINSESFAEDVTQLLLQVYSHRNLNRHVPEDRTVIHALEAVRNALDEIQSIPQEAMREFAPADLLRAVIESAGNASVPASELPDAVELAGWLEAAADDSPSLIVTSVFDGSLPEGASAEPLLHDRLRERLGLPCRASRFTRDQYTLWTVTESRRGTNRVALIAPRRNATGEPTRPSRLLIAGHENAELATRLMALASAPKSTSKSESGGTGFAAPLPDSERMRQFRVFRPTCFRSYLESPRMFYFKYILGLGDETDDAQEMDGGLFGTTVHAVLQQFGTHWLDQNTRLSVSEIEAELEDILCGYMERTFGLHALPPVRAQQLAIWERLRMFAKHQTTVFEEGWQIAYVESHQSLIVPFAVDGAPEDVQLKGKIDRIDRHPDGRWRVIDYKTQSKAKTPEKAHYPSENTGWKDLQLPLYVKLLPAVDSLQNGPIDPKTTELVYFNLPPDWNVAGITEPFPQGKINDAWEKAESIVREVCSGSGCQEIGKMSQFADPAFVALCGLNGLSIGNEGEEE